MNAVPPMFPPHPSLGRAGPDRAADRAAERGVSATAMRWAALADAGKIVATMAGVVPDAPDRNERGFPVLLRDCPAWQRDLAENAVADLAAIMEPGIAALLAINARGADVRPAANALWAEYRAARTAIVALLPRGGGMGPLRSA